MARVCLITPPSPFLLDERVFVSLGVLKVAAALEAAGHAVEHLDLAGVSNYREAVRAHRCRSAATLYGLTATSPQMPAALEIAQELAGARTVLGGPHATLLSAAAKRGVGRAQRALQALLGAFSAVVAGDGEIAILESLNRDGLIDADDPKGPLWNLDHHMPARHLVDLDSYHYTIDGVRATSLIAQLGCPFECAFCGGRSSAMLRRIRTRSTESIVAELIELHGRYDLRGFMFYDDELNVNKGLVDLMRRIAGLGMDLRLRGFIKAELFTDEQAEAMRAAGFRWILVGFESGSERILENIRKKATREDNTRCVEIAHRHGLKVKALMSLGHAGESAETIAETEQWLLDVRPDDFDATIITVYPGTPYYDEAQETEPGIWTYTAKSGDRLHAREVDFGFYKSAPGCYQAHVFTDYLRSDELVSHRDRLEQSTRDSLRISFNPGAPGVKYEASMGMMPTNILRMSSCT